jgi:gentisate 1,2-dioxygenase
MLIAFDILALGAFARDINNEAVYLTGANVIVSPSWDFHVHGEIPP